VAGGAADQVQGVRRARRLEAPLAPEPEAFDRLFADALSATRRQAARLTGDPAGLGLPDAAEAWEAVAEASSSAWAGLVARDLPRAAASSRLRWFRLLLDLPVYTLAGFCVVRAAQGFLQAQYLGLDFLLNAALLALVWLVLVRVGVRRLLAFRARRLLAEVVERAVEAIGAATARLSERVGDDVARRREALKRLSALDEAWRSELARDA